MLLRPLTPTTPNHSAPWAPLTPVIAPEALTRGYSSLFLTFWIPVTVSLCHSHSPAQSQRPHSQTRRLLSSCNVREGLGLSLCQIVQLVEGFLSHVEPFMHTFRQTAFLQTLPHGITDNYPRCDAKHRVAKEWDKKVNKEDGIWEFTQTFTH